MSMAEGSGVRRGRSEGLRIGFVVFCALALSLPSGAQQENAAPTIRSVAVGSGVVLKPGELIPGNA
jgi:hypothetical protein